MAGQLSSCCKDRKLRGLVRKLFYGMADKAVQLSSVVVTGNYEDMRGNFPTEWRTRQTIVSSKFETSQARHLWKFFYRMEDNKAGHLSSVVGIRNCENFRGNFSMEWRTRQANSPLL